MDKQELITECLRGFYKWMNRDRDASNVHGPIDCGAKIVISESTDLKHSSFSAYPKFLYYGKYLSYKDFFEGVGNSPEEALQILSYELDRHNLLEASDL